MTIFATMIAALALGQGPAASSAWTWTLYADASPVVFANEIPDTPQLKATLECAAGSGLVRVSMYGSALAQGFATVASGEASATVQAADGPDGAIVAPLRADHPVFSRFAASGMMSVVIGDARQTVEVQPAHLAALRRFADLCGG